jgi:hypothetical protein
VELKLQSNFFYQTIKTKLVCEILKNPSGIIFLIISFAMFFLIFKLGINTDLSNHLRILEIYLQYGYFPIPPLYYFTIYITGFLMPLYPLIMASIVVLTLFSFLKYYIVQRYLKHELIFLPTLFVGFLSFSLMCLGPLVIPFFNNQFLSAGKFSSTVWHNSTTIFVFPFCIWLFIKSLLYLKTPSQNLWIKILIVSVIIILSKPSFLFSFLIVFPVVCLYKFKWTKWFYYSALLSLIILLLIIAEQRILYHYNPLDRLWYHGETSKIIIAPFKVWLVFAKHPIFNLFSSFLFIIGFILLKYQLVKRDIEILFALSLLFISLLIYFTLAESGPRVNDGNFYWQIPISLLIVYMLLIKKIFSSYKFLNSKYISISTILFTDKILLLFYSFQFLSGIYYAFRLIHSRNFY